MLLEGLTRLYLVLAEGGLPVRRPDDRVDDVLIGRLNDPDGDHDAVEEVLVAGEHVAGLTAVDDLGSPQPDTLLGGHYLGRHDSDAVVENRKTASTVGILQ
jgi:hypothetical protein